MKENLNVLPLDRYLANVSRMNSEAFTVITSDQAAALFEPLVERPQGYNNKMIFDYL